jgi:hypothetical protein
MSHIIPLGKINQFLPKEKLQVPPGNDAHDTWVSDLEESAWDLVRAKLGVLYDTTAWTGQYLDTPRLVVSITGMLTAGWLYDRQFSEEAAQGASYGSRRVEEAYALLDGILDGLYSIDVEVIDDPLGTPSVFESEPVFKMGERI